MAPPIDQLYIFIYLVFIFINKKIPLKQNPEGCKTKGYFYMFLFVVFQIIFSLNLAFLNEIYHLLIEDILKF